MLYIYYTYYLYFDLQNKAYIQPEKDLSNVLGREISNLNTHIGPVDPDCLLLINPYEIIDLLIQVLIKLKISFVKLSFFKISCSKNGINTTIEVMDYDELNGVNYIKFKITQGEKKFYRELCTKILKEISKMKRDMDIK